MKGKKGKDTDTLTNETITMPFNTKRITSKYSHWTKYRVSQFQLCNFERVLRKQFLRFFKFINGFIKLQYWRNFYQKFNTLSKIIRVRIHFLQSATFWKEWEKCIILNIQRERTFFKLYASKTCKSKNDSFWNILSFNFF